MAERPTILEKERIDPMAPGTVVGGTPIGRTEEYSNEEIMPMAFPKQKPIENAEIYSDDEILHAAGVIAPEPVEIPMGTEAYTDEEVLQIAGIAPDAAPEALIPSVPEVGGPAVSTIAPVRPEAPEDLTARVSPYLMKMDELDVNIEPARKGVDIMVQAGASQEQIDTYIQDYSKYLRKVEVLDPGAQQPFIDPVEAMTMGAGTAYKLAKLGGRTTAQAIKSGMAAGTAALTTEVPLGGGIEEIAKDYPGLALPAALLAGGVAGIVEAPFERRLYKALGAAKPAKAERAVGELYEPTVARKPQVVAEKAPPKVEPERIKLKVPKKPIPTLREVFAEEAGAVRIKARKPIAEHFEKTATPEVKKLSKFFEKQDEAANARKKISPAKIVQSVNKAIVDVSGNAKRNLIKKFGREGERAVRHHDLIAGASARSAQELKEAQKVIFRDLDSEQYDVLSRYIQARRAKAITKYKGEEFKHAGGFSSKEYDEFLKTVDTLPDDLAADFKRRADEFFNTTGRKLKELRDAGLITDDAFKAMKEVEYAPRMVMKYLDDSTQYPGAGAGLIDVRDNTIKRLGEGSTEMLENDANILLSEVIGRTDNRIFRNRANIALYETAKAFPDNELITVAKTKPRFRVFDKYATESEGAIRSDWDPDKMHKWIKKQDNPDDFIVVREDVTIGKVPADKVEVSLWVDGKRKSLLLDKDLGNEWIMKRPELSEGLAKFAQMTSGAPVLRAMATGYNPAFILTNTPRDIAHAWLVTEEYSTILPKGIAQIFKDMGEVFGDAVKRKGRYIDYINEGGGMTFLTGQGQFRRGNPKSKLNRSLNAVQDALGYLGETSEILTRLAIRERALKNGKSASEATWAARNYLDFSQGGSMTKALDNAVPYLNASVQGTRGLFRAAARGTRKEKAFGLVNKKFLAQVAQIGMLSSGLYYANRFGNPEAWEQISDHEKTNYFIITTPFSYTDDQGNKKYFYFRIAKDQGQRVFTSIFENLSAKAIGDDISEEQLTQAVTEFIPLSPSNMLPPTLEASLGYASNTDFWRDEDIWKARYSGDVEPKEEYTNYTHPFFVKAGELTNLSPERMKYALSQVFTNGNIYTAMTGWTYKKMMGEMDETDKRVFQDKLLKMPFIKRVAKSTNPYFKEEKRLKEAKKKDATERLKQNRSLDNISKAFLAGNKTEEDVKNHVRSLPDKEDRKRLWKRHERHKRLEGVPNRRMWMDIAEMSPKMRARQFFLMWKEGTPEERRKMEKTAKQVPGITSDRFYSEFRKLRRSNR